MTNARQSACGDDNFREKLPCSLKRGAFQYKIYDLGPEKVFTVHSRGVFTQDKLGYFSNSKRVRKKWDWEKVFTIKGCSLIRGVHYERFHCIYIFF